MVIITERSLFTEGTGQAIKNGLEGGALAKPPRPTRGTNPSTSSPAPHGPSDFHTQHDPPLGHVA